MNIVAAYVFVFAVGFLIGHLRGEAHERERRVREADPMWRIERFKARMQGRGSGDC